MLEKMVVNNRYTIIKQLGSGGMGNIYLCNDKINNDKTIALKEIKGIISPNNIADIKHEFEIMCRLNHPNIIQVYDLGINQEDNTYFITMEYLDEGSFKGARETSQENFLSIFISLCRALNFIHSRNIIHRDINPDNIMKSDGTVKLMDFGLSDDTSDDTTTKGTISFMAPEVLTKSPSIQSDIFSLGMTLVSIYFGDTIYGDVSPNDIIRILKSEDNYSTTLNYFISNNNTSLVKILTKMISFQLKDRYKNCAEILLDLEKHNLSSAPIETKNTKNAYVLGVDFIGRQEELTLLKKHLVQKDTKILWIQGDPGVGKSRLFTEFKKICRLQDIPFFEGSCLEGITKQFGPFLPILNELLYTTSQPLINKYGTQLKKILPHHASLQDIKSATIEDPQTEYLLSIKAISQFLLGTAEYLQKDIQLYLNDMHWSDSGSIDILDRLLTLLTSQKKREHTLILTISSRFDNLEKFEQIRHQDCIQQHILRPLYKKNVEEYIYSIFGPDFISDSIKNKIGKIHVRAGGNPLYLQEMIKLLIDKELIKRDGVKWEFGNDNFESFLPSSIQDLIGSRLTNLNLNEEEQYVLQIIAIVNRVISFEELTSITHISYSFIEKLQKLELLKAENKENIVYYKISHDLINDTILKTIKKKKKIYTHVAQSIETTYKDSIENYVEELSKYYLEIKDHDKILHYLQKSIEKSLDNNENKKAEKFIDSLLVHFKDSLEEKEQKVAMLNLKARLIFYEGSNLESAIKLNKEALTIAKTTGNLDLIALTMMVLGSRLIEANDPEALSVLETATEICQQENIQDLLSLLHTSLGVYHQNVRKDLDKAINFFMEGLKIGQSINYTKGILLNIGNLAVIAFQQGDFQKAIDLNKKSYHYIKKIDSKYYAEDAFLELSKYYFYAKNYDSALEYVNKQLPLALEISNERDYLRGITLKARIYFAQNQYQDSITTLSEMDEHIELLNPSIQDDKNTLFEYYLLFHKTNFALGEKDKSITAVKNLQIEYTTTDFLKRIEYELWLMTEDDSHRVKALEFYEDLLKTSFFFEDKDRYKELKNNTPQNQYPKISKIEQPLDQSDDQEIEDLEMSSELNSFFAKFSQEKRDLQKGIKDSISQTIDNLINKKFIDLNKQIYAYNKEQSSKSNLATAITESLPLSELLSSIADFNSCDTLSEALITIVDASINFLQAERGAIILKIGSGEMKTEVARDYQKKSILDISISQTIIKQVIEEKVPLFIPDLIDDSPVSLSQSIADLNLRSIMCAPFISKSNGVEKEVFGLIYLDSTESTEFSGFKEHNIHLLNALAAQASGVVNNILLREELEKTIEKQNNIEFALHKAKIEAEHANNVKSHYLSNISSEMRMPINTIIRIIENQKKDSSVQGTQTNNDILLNKSKYLLSLVDTVLNQSTEMAQEIQIENKEFNLKSTIDTVFKRTLDSCKHKNLTCTLHVDKNIATHVMGDSFNLQQILDILLDNAVKYTHEGYINFSINLKKDEKLQLHFSIEDSGSGIPKEKQQNLLKQDENSLFVNSGVGLSIASQLSQLMGSALTFTSEKNKGSTFTFSIPYHPVESSSQNSTVGTILVVDDNPVNSQVIKKHLTSIGHTIHIAENGQEAIELCKSIDFSIIIMDLQMPIMKGDEATQIIRSSQSQNADIPIIGVTTNGDPISRKICLQAGMNTVLIKPIRRHLLLNEVSRYLQGYEHKQQVPLNLAAAIDEFGSEDVVKEIVIQFIANLEFQIVDMYKALKEENISFIEQEAHSIKGAACSIEASALFDVALLLEEQCKSKENFSTITATVDSLKLNLHLLQEYTDSLKDSVY